MANFTLTTGLDTFTGTPGQRNTFFIAPGTLQSTDVLTGGATGGFIDVLASTAGGTYTASQFAGGTRVEELDLASAANSVTLSNARVAGSDTGTFVVVGGAGSDVVDASASTSTPIVFFAGA